LNLFLFHLTLKSSPTKELTFVIHRFNFTLSFRFKRQHKSISSLKYANVLQVRHSLYLTMSYQNFLSDYEIL